MSGDHGIMVGHASDETEDGMPFRRLTEVREPAKLCGLGPPPPSWHFDAGAHDEVVAQLARPAAVVLTTMITWLQAARTCAISTLVLEIKASWLATRLIQPAMFSGTTLAPRTWWLPSSVEKLV